MVAVPREKLESRAGSALGPLRMDMMQLRRHKDNPDGWMEARHTASIRAASLRPCVSIRLPVA